MKKINLIPILTLLLLLFVGCCPCRLGSSKPQLIEIGSSWRALQMGSKTFEGSEGYAITFTAEGQVVGRGDCNRIMGEYTITESRTLDIDKVAATRAMCPDAERERLFIEALESSDSYSIDGESLVLLKQGTVLMIMERVDEL